MSRIPSAEVAASADGSVEFRVQRGSIRASIAELVEVLIDQRELGAPGRQQM